MDKVTHVEILKPKINVRYLADYMAASERKRRSIVTTLKYRPIARLLQHHEAKLVVSNALRSNDTTSDELSEKSDFIRNKITEDDFESQKNESNADYVKRFSDVYDEIEFPEVEFIDNKKFEPQNINGLVLTFHPDLLFRRITKTNKVHIGAAMLRYAKGAPLTSVIGDYQSAIIFGLLDALEAGEGIVVDKALCITVDAYSGKLYTAPGSFKTMWANAKAACESIAERWEKIPPPKNAVF